VKHEQPAVYTEIVQWIASLKRSLAPWANLLRKPGQRDIVAEIFPTLLLRLLFSSLLLFEIPA